MQLPNLLIFQSIFLIFWLTFPSSHPVRRNLTQKRTRGCLLFGACLDLGEFQPGPLRRTSTKMMVFHVFVPLEMVFQPANLRAIRFQSPMLSHPTIGQTGWTGTRRRTGKIPMPGGLVRVGSNDPYRGCKATFKENVQLETEPRIGLNVLKDTLYIYIEVIKFKNCSCCCFYIFLIRLL